MWPQSNLSLAVDLWDHADKMPAQLARRMRASVSRTDDVFPRMGHDLAPEGEGFVKAAHSDTLEPRDVRDPNRRCHTQLWTTGYGDATDARIANLCLLRYRQASVEGYKDLALAAADRYLDAVPNTEFPLYPGTFGHVILLLADTYALTDEQRYLNRANHFARYAIEVFSGDDAPLPQASSQHDHYEAITLADTLMMGLLKLWAVQSGMDGELPIFTDR